MEVFKAAIAELSIVVTVAMNIWMLSLLPSIIKPLKLLDELIFMAGTTIAPTMEEVKIALRDSFFF